MASERRKALDVKKLIEGEFEVKFIEGYNLFHVKFYGPDDTLYKNGVWKIQVQLPANYPRNPPAINFLNRIYHPNIDALFGTICLDLLNEHWCAKYNLNNVFDHFLPSLLLQPNPTDALNKKAADLYLHQPENYLKRVASYIDLYATEEILSKFVPKEPTESDISDDEGPLEGYPEKSETDGNDENAVKNFPETLETIKAICMEIEQSTSKASSDVNCDQK
ncbi:ubiquitin-conjugating enzyme E2 H-like [Teleopsis dalmanni]|uniref:ubiquitin-conjugating enzyme E2 H-like n=1 Tax=Teleopsis dalmanni TaxID=139649 RepID=UPI0018CEB9DB|nr:ubiquitin-conjugating enzyme E2 H-like [Teleopsis dalmanni]XP_037927299.1 ubiquitin-conjugating enzyme E2 H-like [Teleopsis dalmanni]